MLPADRRSSTSDQRVRIEPGFAPRRGYLFRIGRGHAWAAVAAGMALGAVLDIATGPEFWVGPLYLCFIGLAAWALGHREALACFAVALLVSSIVNANSLYPYHLPMTLGDLLLRTASVLGVILLLTHARNSCEREWRTARIDPLTGALNRKAFFELIEPIEQSKHWHLLAYADLDGFKRLNDEYGHARGDERLRAFASSVTKAIRKDDIFARIGGDEFLVCLAVRDEAAGRAVAKRLHRAMTATPDPAGGPVCSVGALLLAPGPRSINRELRCADRLMYEAKQHGGALALATGQDREGELVVSAAALFGSGAEEAPALLQPGGNAEGSAQAAITRIRARTPKPAADSASPSSPAAAKGGESVGPAHLERA